MTNILAISDEEKLLKQLQKYDSLSDKDKLDYFCAVISKIVQLLSESDKNVFDSIISKLDISPRYHKQLLNSGLLILFNNIWTHDQLLSLCKEFLEYNESFVCNTGQDLSDSDISQFILSKVRD